MFPLGVGEWNWRFENLVRNILIQCLGWRVEHPRGLTTWTINHVSEKTPRAFCFRHSIYRIDRIGGIVIGMGNGMLCAPTPT